MALKSKSTAALAKATKANAKPSKPPVVAEPEKPATRAEKSKKRKLDDEPEDAGLEKKRRKAVVEGVEVVKGGKAVVGKKSGVEGKPAKAVTFGKTTTKKVASVPAVKKSSMTSVKSKPSKKAAEPETHDEEEVPEEGENNADEEMEDDVIHGFSSGSDSSDEDDDGVDAAPVDIAKLPTIAKDDETVRRRLERAKKQRSEAVGVLYLGRIPHGFYEGQMRSFFSQFGNVTRLRLSRNKKTGRSKHYGFIEFDSLPVAEIVADTMNNYLMFGHLLQCRIIPADKVHAELWVGANRKFRAVPQQRVARLKHNKERTEEQQEKSNARLLKRQEEKKRKLAEMGIDYDLDAAGFKKPATTEVKMV